MAEYNDMLDIEQILEWIGFTTADQIDAIKEDLMPDGIGLDQLLRESADGIEEVCSHYNKRNPSTSRFYVSRVKVKHLQNLMYHVKDMERVGMDPNFDDSVDEDEFFDALGNALERELMRKEMKSNNKNLIASEFQIKLKNRNQWERWLVELKVTLGGIIGARGINLNYVIRESDDPQVDQDDWDSLAKNATPLGGEKYRRDAKTVHHIILRNISDDSDAYTYLKPKLKSEDGRKDYKALLERYDGHSSKETRINEAKSLIKTLQYRNERSMPFERFTEKLQRAIDDLALGGRPMHNDDIVDLIWPKILNNEIKEFVVALKVNQARNPRGYKEILQDIATEVPKLSPTSNFSRTTAEINTSSDSKYTRDGPCPPSGVMTNGKVFIGNYHGKKWFDDSVKPYHEEIRKARAENPRPTNGNQNNGGSQSGGNNLSKQRRKLRKVRRQLKKAKEQKRKIQALKANPQKDDGLTESDSSDDESKNAGNAFGGRNAKGRNKKRKDKR